MDNDTISRQAAIDAAVKMFEAWYGGSVQRGRVIRARFDQLPPVHPEQKHGHWIVTDIPNLTSTAQDVVTFTRQCRCSECGALFGRKSDKYCYNCGARMEGWNDDR